MDEAPAKVSPTVRLAIELVKTAQELNADLSRRSQELLTNRALMHDNAALMFELRAAATDPSDQKTIADNMARAHHHRTLARH